MSGLFLAGTSGFEPLISGLSGRRSEPTRETEENRYTVQSTYCHYHCPDTDIVQMAVDTVGFEAFAFGTVAFRFPQMGEER